MYVTTKQRGDGFGAILQNMIFDILYATVHNYTYIYTIQDNMEHNYTNEPTYINRLFKFINFENLFPKPPLNETIHICPLEVVYPFVEHNLDILCEMPVMKLLKDTFIENKVSPYDNSKHHIAIHIRRPNIHDSRIYGSDTPNATYINIMKRIRDEYNGYKPIQFHIYSQGSFNGQSEFENFNPIFHIDTSIEDTFLGLVFADTLLTCQSSFSYIAGILTNNDVYYMNFWHPPRKHWKTV